MTDASSIDDALSQPHGEPQEQDMSICDMFDDEAELPKTTGELLEERLIANKSAKLDDGMVVAQAYDINIQPLAAEEKKEAIMTCAAMRQRLSGLLQARTLATYGIGRKGGIHSASLYKLRIGDTKICQRRTEGASLDTAIHILVDCSASMENEAIKLARQACYAVAKSLSGLSGVNPAVTIFPAPYRENSVCQVLRHGQRMRDNFQFNASGDTPFAPALWHVMREMLKLKEERKIILVLTDGVPNSVIAAKAAIGQAQKMGIEVYGIGVLCPLVHHLLPKHSKDINNLSDLAPAMFGVLKDAMLKGERK